MVVLHGIQYPHIFECCFSWVLLQETSEGYGVGGLNCRLLRCFAVLRFAPVFRAKLWKVKADGDRRKDEDWLGSPRGKPPPPVFGESGWVGEKKGRPRVKSDG